MTAITVAPAPTVMTRPTPVTEQLGLAKLLALFLIPGAIMTAVFVVLAPVVETAGFPPIAALLVAIVIVLVPFEVGVIVRAARAQGVPVRSVIPYRRPLHLRDWLWLVPVLIVAEFLGFGISMAIEPSIIANLFGWLPDWFIRPIDPDRVGEYSRAAWMVTLAAYLALNGFIGPIVEELYFRGYLLPRMEWMGRLGPLVNVTLFSVYHFWSPWQVLGRILALAPTVYAVRWKQNIYLGMVIHCTGNVLGIILVANLVLGRV
jgi:membrane protease YdiL (CAAX protease family)